MTEPVKIPIQNIYYLLCYAWNRLEERDVVDITGIDSTNLADLFAKVLIGGVSHLLKRGFDRGYIEFIEDTRCLRGKLLFNPTIKRNLLIKAQVTCGFDELSYNVLHNQILKSSIGSLICIDSIDSGLKNELIGLYRKLHEIDDIRLTSECFSRIQLNRNNAFYDFLLKICELIYDNLLASEDPGKSKFRDFFQDENRMPRLFEDFVRNFYKLEAPGYHVSREDIYWYAKGLNDPSAAYLPKMETDISIEDKESKVVIDTKYYKEALQKYYDTEKIHSQNIYQIFAYLKNLEMKGGINQYCTGVLLYPTVDNDIHFCTMLDPKHKVIVRTLNLNQDWKLIHQDLIELLKASHEACMDTIRMECNEVLNLEFNAEFIRDTRMNKRAI
jgi:5-methylcytosine-specific restriction enzyme subunit McrC